MKLIKKCKNPECQMELRNYKSSKRLYCDDTCKNRSAYLKRTIEEGHLLETDKATKKNYRILKKLRDFNLGPLSEQTLLSHGFDFDAYHGAVVKIDDNGNKEQINHIYDIYFQNKDSKIIIIKN